MKRTILNFLLIFLFLIQIETKSINENDIQTNQLNIIKQNGHGGKFSNSNQFFNQLASSILPDWKTFKKIQNQVYLDYSLQM